MILLAGGELAAAAGAELARDAPGSPGRASIDSRDVRAGDLFVGLAGERDDGGCYAPDALAAGAWGVVVSPAHAAAALEAGGGAVLVAPEPLQALQHIARRWRAELGAQVYALTGSTGKTSTKDILASLLTRAGLEVVATPGNLNTEIGVPLVILSASRGCQALVLEFAMRGEGQIALLTALADPDVGLIVNVGPAHIELLGSIDAIAAAKAELFAGLRPGAAAVLPADEPLLARHVRADLENLTFGPGGDVELTRDADGAATIVGPGRTTRLEPDFAQRHQLRNLVAAVAAAWAGGVDVAAGPLAVAFSGMRGARLELPDGIELIDDSYNANPDSMRAALVDLADTAPGRRVAVLGEMCELGSHAPALHEEVGREAARSGVEVLIAVGEHAAQLAGPLGSAGHVAGDVAGAAELADELLRPGDTVLVKGSRAVGMEAVVGALVARRGPAEPR
ncbi:MAG TPA: UDP-N-acetylmuramoyl-tripeptide--D-alanyl-D-alanine ligase [Solirubrobacteraceae bacterium]|nr:UDP-N-acetylmuramoyl-tripeptide--D-alanyl-D-alanine ligase [Solirubrobacteraceae bacterium]